MTNIIKIKAATVKTSQQKENIAKFYREQVTTYNNCSNADFGWIGEGSNPIEYSFLYDMDQENGTTTSLSSIVGTVALVEQDPWNTYIHLSGFDPNLGDQTFWEAQILGIKGIEASFPEVNGTSYSINSKYFSDDIVVFKIKLDSARHPKQVPLFVVDNNDAYLQEPIKELITAGDLIIIYFVPYAYSLGEYAGISLSAKQIKLVKSNYLTKACVDVIPTVPITKAVGPSPVKKQKIMAQVRGPSTSNLGF